MAGIRRADALHALDADGDLPRDGRTKRASGPVLAIPVSPEHSPDVLGVVGHLPLHDCHHLCAARTLHYDDRHQ